MLRLYVAKLRIATNLEDPALLSDSLKEASLSLKDLGFKELAGAIKNSSIADADLEPLFVNEIIEGLKKQKRADRIDTFKQMVNQYDTYFDYYPSFTISDEEEANTVNLLGKNLITIYYQVFKENLTKEVEIHKVYRLVKASSRFLKSRSIYTLPSNAIEYLDTMQFLYKTKVDLIMYLDNKEKTKETLIAISNNITSKSQLEELERLTSIIAENKENFNTHFKYFNCISTLFRDDVVSVCCDPRVGPLWFEYAVDYLFKTLKYYEGLPSDAPQENNYLLVKNLIKELISLYNDPLANRHDSINCYRKLLYLKAIVK